MIYLDHAAATPVSPKAFTAMQPYFSEKFFNPSAPYLPAKHVREAYESAKNEIAHAIGAKSADLVITAGATESINLAFTACRVDANSSVLVAATEHAAVLEAAKRFPYQLIPVDQHGLIDLNYLRGVLLDSSGDQIVLVSISLANNELGTIQPLSEVAEILRLARASRLARGVRTPLYLHSDASQALTLIDINIARLGADLLTLNAAKCGGPKGIGALYVGRGIQLWPLAVGGGQERGLRSGTENVPGVMGFAAAVTESRSHLSSNRQKYTEMREALKQGILHGLEKNTDQAPEAVFLGSPKHQLANFLPICFPGIDAERIIYKLEAKDILLSTGAACAANKGSKSHVLAAIGLSDDEIAGSLRISLGSTNTLEQMPIAAKAITRAVIEEQQRISHGA